ncbi:hypothetical protein CAPTEDRAFT_205771, partial [Capitella teleta]
MEGAPKATAREVKLKKKMIVLDDVSQLTSAEHAEILLLQAQKKVKSAIGMIKKSVDDTRCNNPLRRIHVVRGGAPIASTSTPPRSRARTGRAGETVFPLNPSCAMSEQSDGMVYDVADIADKRDRSADDIFNNADMKVDPYTMPTVDTIAKVIDDVVATITDVCAEEMRRPTVYALGRQMLASPKSGFASVAFNAVAISHLMQGHEDEVASGSNQEDVFVSYAYPRKAELAAGMVAVARVRADRFDSTVPWGEDCAAVTGLTADEVQPIAMRMHRLTLELPAAPYEWKSAVAGFVGCSSLGEFLDMADTMSPYYNG